MASKIKYDKIENYEEADNFCFRITEGEFKGTVFQYDTITLLPPEGYTWEDLELKKELESQVQMSYNYQVLEGVDGLGDNPTFQDAAGEILIDFLQETFDSGNYMIGDKDASKPRNDNPEESH